MAQRRLPVRPNLEQLRHQAKELLREIRRGDPVAVALLSMPPHDPADVKLAQAQMRWLAATASPGGCGWCSRSPHRRDLARRRRSSARALARASAAPARVREGGAPTATGSRTDACARCATAYQRVPLLREHLAERTAMLEFGAANSCFHGNARRSAVVAEGSSCSRSSQASSRAID
ncbi:MAG: hypothetical protein E6J58_19080 [Deltaproteobacteria bacterium]|nr:MAG: hypothetical protein E6J58_19080 [Deltaproteobacteria bacterium]